MATYTSHLNLKLPDYSDVADIKDLNDNFKKIDDAIASGGTGGGTGGGLVTETDPTVPSWAKQPNKPSYTADEVGALPDTTVIPTVPNALPNPQPIVINGISYDGSERKEITVQAGSGGSITETDPTVPAWAKAATKPTYTAEEVGALPNTYNPPVKSVNGKTGNVTLAASDVGALPSTTVIPTVPSAIKNPYPLTINGVEYDGSEAKTVNIQASGGGESVSLDTTLTQYGMAADAGAVGNAIGQEKQAREQDIEELEGKMVSLDATLTQSGQAADAKATGDALNELKEANVKQDAAIEALKQAGGGTAYTSPLTVSDTSPMGQIWENPEGITYMAWPLGCLQYDKDINKVVQLCSCQATHTTGNDASGGYIAYLDPDTYELTQPVRMVDTDGNIPNFASFCILSDGTWMGSSGYTIYKSADKGATWVSQGVAVNADGAAMSDVYGIISPYRNMVQLSNGRIVIGAWASKMVYAFYSDDLGATWSAASIGSAMAGSQEPCFVELEEGKLLTIIRKSMFGTGLDAWNATAPKIDEAAYYSTSIDYGTSWTTLTESTVLTDMCACPAFLMKYDDCVEVFYGSRREYANGSEGCLYHAVASYEDAMNDKWSDPVVILYSTSQTALGKSNFGYITGCKDANGKMHFIYYDTIDKETTDTTYKYILADRKHVTKPTRDGLTNRLVLWSGYGINAELLRIYNDLNAKINKIIISGGGEIEDGLDGSLYVTNGLYDAFDFRDESTYDAETAEFTGIKKTLTMAYAAGEWSSNVPADKTFNADGLVRGYLSDDLSALDTDAGWTIEFMYKLVNPVTNNSNFIQFDKFAYGYQFGVSSRGLYRASYLDQEGATKTNDVWFTAASSGTAGKYQSLVIQKSGNVFKYYLNGEHLGDNDVSAIDGFSGIPAALYTKGISIINGATPVGSFVMMLVYNKALNEAEIKNNYKWMNNTYKS